VGNYREMWGVSLQKGCVETTMLFINITLKYISEQRQTDQYITIAQMNCTNTIHSQFAKD